MEFLDDHCSLQTSNNTQKSNLHPFLVRALGFGVYNRLEKGANLTPAAAMSLKATHTQTNHKKYLNKEVRKDAKQLGYFGAFCVSAPAFENF